VDARRRITHPESPGPIGARERDRKFAQASWAAVVELVRGSGQRVFWRVVDDLGTDRFLARRSFEALLYDEPMLGPNVRVPAMRELSKSRSCA
jgi:hypothetical protein